MFSIINEIEKYIKENGIVLNDFAVSSKYFPREFNYVVLEKLKKESNVKNESFNKYYIHYENGHIQLLALSRNNHTILSVIPSDTFLKTNISSKKVRENEILNESFDLYRYIRGRIGGSLGWSDRNNLFAYYTMLEETAKECCDYLKYLDDMYQETLLEEQKEYDLSIKFSQRTDNTGTGEGHTRGLGSSNVERLNEIIPAYDRQQVLESYENVYKGTALGTTDEGIDELDYFIYLYKVNNKYVLVLDPYNGNKYMRVVYLNLTEDELNDKEYIEELIRNYLEFSNLELLEQDNAIRLGHTTIEKFKNDLDFIIKGTGKVSPYTKKRIDKQYK